MACVVKSRPAELRSCRAVFSERVRDQYQEGKRTG